MIGRMVMVETSDGKKYQGELLGINDKLSLVLNQAGEAGENVFRVVLNGDFVKELKLIEKPFDLRALGERLEKVFPGLVVVRDEIGAVIVMDKIKITEQGVVEGAGLSADRAKAVYEEFSRTPKK